ncbi:MAG: HAD-IIIA family hydrolase [Lachnobacterium sp.]|nr:HAD-IIIA family hydrolase [Lachnobacterium sp.]
MKKEFFEQTYHRAGVAQEHKAVIFDLDGTLLDTLEDLKDATNAALASQGMPQCTLDQVRRYVGNGVRKLMVRAVPDGEKNPLFEQTFAAFKEYYAAHCLDHTAPYPDVLKVMKELKERGIKIAIVSNKLDSAVKELNEKFFQGYTSAAIGEMEGVARKPAPDMVEKALRELGVTKSDAIYVGDSDVDIQTAKNSGLDCISVTWGFRDVPFLLEHGAKTMIDKPLELLSQV